MDLTGVVDAMQRLYAAVSAPAAEGGAGSMELPGLLELVEEMQHVQNVAAAVQSRALAHVAAHDEEPAPDAPRGWVWKRHALGHISDEAASLVADRLGVSVPVATRRVEDAVHQTRVTPRLLDAGGSGELDAWRTRLVTAELRVTEDESVARETVDRLADLFTKRGRWGETAGPLSARTARLVRRIDPSVAAGDGERARRARCVSRRADGPAADQWFARLPVETSLPMWAAVDERAHQLQRTDTTLTLEQARADALAELVLDRTSVTVHLHATVPAGTSGVGVQAELDAAAAGGAVRAPSADGPGSAEGRDNGNPGAVDAARTTAFVAGGVVEAGGLGRPGTTTLDPARLPDVVRVVESTTLTCDPDTGALVAGYVPASLAPRRHGRPRPADPADNHAAAEMHATDTVADSAHEADGATVADDPGAAEVGLRVEPQYRPSAALQRLVRARDGTCRFPGCLVPARDCDLDHVIPWPDGPTTAAHLACGCRRHHRVKQRPGWSVRLEPDGVMHWTDPTGRTMTTYPVDHLDRLMPPNGITERGSTGGASVSQRAGAPERPRDASLSARMGTVDESAGVAGVVLGRRTQAADAATLGELTLERFLALVSPRRRQLEPTPPGRRDLQQDPAPPWLDAFVLDSAAYRTAQQAAVAAHGAPVVEEPPF
ncbi:hypothetical protein BCF74_10470 [Knoellia remsis]|uniref:HNH nuclease domain-containing protein n=1 Tax=Knoellia remsis TaxID=407159 RepID=A0A2T0UXL7_9MICO|nr:HNH endonuclease [Knoellia remsis]PRY62634.1 hypothetical protein BCF74_10470 [Knoellia remsis]